MPNFFTYWKTRKTAWADFWLYAGVCLAFITIFGLFPGPFIRLLVDLPPEAEVAWRGYAPAYIFLFAGIFYQLGALGQWIYMQRRQARGDAPAT